MSNGIIYTSGIIKVNKSMFHMHSQFNSALNSFVKLTVNEETHSKKTDIKHTHLNTQTYIFTYTHVVGFSMFVL